MKNIPMLLLTVYVISFSSCKKSSGSTASPNNIVGTWAMTNFSGYIVSNVYTGYMDSDNYLYNAATKTLMQVRYATTGISQDTGDYRFTTEIWAFNTNGTYAINESYADTSANPATVTSLNTGTWEYEGNTQSNDGFVLNGNPYFFIGNLIRSDAYVIQSVTNSTLVITFMNTSVSSPDPAWTTETNITITFTKQ